MPALIETVRIRGGTAPLWPWHLARLAASCRALDLPVPLLSPPEGGADRVLRLQVGEEGVVQTERELGSTVPVRLITARVRHAPYPHKTTDRARFEEALSEARAAGADDALMLTASGHLAECAIWSLLWWDGEILCAPELTSGVLPGVARARIARLRPIEERRSPRRELDRFSMFVVNAVRGVLPVASLDGRMVAPHGGTSRLQAAFWNPEPPA
jgi:4-amino-4-deoxychorismate lyase